jgi:hypothetical protein
MRAQTHDDVDPAPVHLKGTLVPARFDVIIDLGSATRTCRCLGLAADGFVIQTDKPLPANQVLRCRLRLPDGDLELFAFATAGGRRRQEIKPMGLKGDVAEKWESLRTSLDDGDSLAAPGRPGRSAPGCTSRFPRRAPAGCGACSAGAS